MAQRSVVIDVEERSTTGTSANRRLRRSGRIPAVVYGLQAGPFKLLVSGKRVDEILRLDSGRNTILELSLANRDQKREVMIKDLQRDPVSGEVIHVDFLRLDLTKKLTVTVPILLVGTAQGVKNEAGMVDFIHRTVEVECLPSNIPEHLDVEVSHLHINQHVSVGDLQVAEGVEVLADPATVIAVVVPPRAEAVAAEEEVEEAAAATEEEPEVLKKGKEAEGEAAPAAQGD